MGEPPPFDPCECIFSPAGAMRRLISLLRNSQSYCTDEQCFGTAPEPNGSGGDNGMTMVYMAIAWVVLALVLYMFRPASLRGGDDKPRPNNDNNDEPPAPPIM